MKETRACPFCWEEILAVAKKCKHCGEIIKSDEEIAEEKNFKPIVYWKCKPIKILSVCWWWFCALSLIFMWIGLNSTETKQPEQNTEWTWEVAAEVENTQKSDWPGNWFIFFGFLFLIPIWQLFMKKLIIDKDHVTIKSWIIFKKSEDIKYKKINNISKSSFLGFWGIKIFTWNDKPVVFDNLESYEDVLDFINKRIDS